MQQMPATYKPVFVPLAYNRVLTSPPISPLREVIINEAFAHSTMIVKNYTRAVAPRIPLLFRDRQYTGP